MNLEINIGKLFSKNFIYQDCLDVDLLSQATDTPEAYPLLHREFQVENWKSAFPGGNLLALWIGHAIFLRNLSLNSIKKETSNKLFSCLAFSMYKPDNEEHLIPKIYVANRRRVRSIITSSRDVTNTRGSSKTNKIKSAFKACGAFNAFEFYESRLKDPSGDGEIIWLYCISSNDLG